LRNERKQIEQRLKKETKKVALPRASEGSKNPQSGGERNLLHTPGQMNPRAQVHLGERKVTTSGKNYVECLVDERLIVREGGEGVGGEKLRGSVEAPDLNAETCILGRVPLQKKGETMLKGILLDGQLPAVQNRQGLSGNAKKCGTSQTQTPRSKGGAMEIAKTRNDEWSVVRRAAAIWEVIK